MMFLQKREMIMSRSLRSLLLCVCGALLAFGLSGCKKKTKTTVIFLNISGNGSTTLSIDATVGKQTFKINNIAPGSQATQTFYSDDVVDSTAPVTGSAVRKSGNTIFGTLDLSSFPPGSTYESSLLTYGRTNTYYSIYIDPNDSSKSIMKRSVTP